MSMDRNKAFMYVEDFVKADSDYTNAAKNLGNVPKDLFIWLVRQGKMVNGEFLWEIYNGEQVGAYTKTGETALVFARLLNESRGLISKEEPAKAAKKAASKGKKAAANHVGRVVRSKGGNF